MKSKHRAFTIVEALLATALLAILAAASAGLLRDAARLTQPDGQHTTTSADDIAVLGLLADLVLDDPESVGLTASPEQIWDGAMFDTSSFDLMQGDQALETSFRTMRFRLVTDTAPPDQRRRQRPNAWLIVAAIDRADRVVAEVARRVRVSEEAQP